MKDSNLLNKVVFLQGAGRHPGPLLAKAFAAQGAIVAACDLSPVLLDPLEAASPNIHTYIGDASRGMPARAILDEVLSEWGRIDILVNNPRVAPGAPVLDLDDYDWQHTIEVNLNGAFLLTKLVGLQMRELGQGVILNLVEDEPLAQFSAAYAASQAGVAALTAAAGRELIAYNIRVYALCLAREKGIQERGDLIELALALCAGKLIDLEGQTIQAFVPALEDSTNPKEE